MEENRWDKKTDKGHFDFEIKELRTNKSGNYS